MSGVWEAVVHQNGSMSCPRAPPRGFARDATAVADMRPSSVNQSSLYRVGAARTKGCACGSQHLLRDVSSHVLTNPINICPNMTTPKMPPVDPFDLALVPAYLIQFPTSISALQATVAGFGPPLFSTHITAGAATTKAKRKPVLSQFTADRETPNHSAVVDETGANVSQSQLTMMFNSDSWTRPNQRRL